MAAKINCRTICYSNQSDGMLKYDQLKMSSLHSTQLLPVPYRRPRPEMLLVNPCRDSASMSSNLGTTSPVPLRNLSDHSLSTSLPHNPSCGPSLDNIGHTSIFNSNTISALSTEISFVVPDSPPRSQVLREASSSTRSSLTRIGILDFVSPCDSNRVELPTQMLPDRPVQEPQNHSMRTYRLHHQFDDSAVNNSIISQEQPQSQSLDFVPMNMGTTCHQGQQWLGNEDRLWIEDQ